MQTILFKSLIAALLAFTTYVSWSFAGEHHGCQRCGCACQVTKVCQLTCETKKVPETKFSMECEDFCVTGPTKKCNCQGQGCPHCRPTGAPDWASMFTRKKLMKTVTEKEIKVYKWVVVDLCAQCAAQTEIKK
jgi:hypothetical protein